MTESKNKLIKAVISVSGIVLLAKILGFVKQIVTANAFGATIQTDMITLAYGIISNMDYLLITSLSTAFIPTYIQLSQQKNSTECEKFVSDTIKIFFVATCTLATIFFWGSPLIARVLAPSYSDELSHQLADYIRQFAPIIILLVELSIFNSLLKAKQQFIPSELIGFNQSAIIIILVVMFGVLVGPDILVYSFYAYAVFNLIFLMLVARKHWHIYRGLPFSNPQVKKLLYMMGPLLIGYSVVFVNQLVDKIIMSSFSAGTITAISYASVLSNFVATFIGSISGVLFTYITKNIAEGKYKSAANLTTDSSIQLITFCLPITIITIMNATDIVTLVFGRGNFDSAAIENCSLALIGYSFMFVPFAIRELYSRFQYSYGDSKSPMKNSTFSIVANIILSIVLCKTLGVFGVTLATSISVALCALLNIRTAKQKNAYILWTNYFNHSSKWLLGTLICISISLILKDTLCFTQPLIRLISIIFLSFGGYCIIVWPIIKSMLQK